MIGGIPELIRVGENGELFESGNKEQMKVKISQMWGTVNRLADVPVDMFDDIASYCEKILGVI